MRYGDEVEVLDEKGNVVGRGRLRSTALAMWLTVQSGNDYYTFPRTHSVRQPVHARG